MLIYLLGLPLYALISGGASALHGTDKTNKGVAIGVHLFFGLACGWFTPLCVAIYWGFLRRSEQAIAELDYLGKDYHPTGGSLEKIKQAYPPLIGSIMGKVMEYVQHNPWPYTKDQPSRVQQEFCGAFVLGAILYALSLPFALIIEGAL